ncbi:MAG: hypothetical protein ACPL3P_08575, partial [Anaerolineales bacterium]
MIPIILLILLVLFDFLIIMNQAAYNRPHLARQVFAKMEESAAEKFNVELSGRIEALQAGLLHLHALLWLAIGLTLFLLHQDPTLAGWFSIWGILFLLLAILLAEWLLYLVVDARNESWAVTFIPLARLITNITYPFQRA